MFYSDDIDSIYAFMYGSPFLYCGNHWEQDKVIKIPKDDLTINSNKDCLIYTWGYPGPDRNYYYFEDYGKTWVFADKELKNV